MKFLDVLLTALKCIVIELMDNMDIMHFKVVLTLEGTTPETSMTVQVKDIIISDDDHWRLWWENYGTAEIGGRLVLVWWPFGCGQPIVMNGHFGLD